MRGARFSFSALAPGTHTFSVFATDTAGNADPTPATRTWTVVLDPVADVLASKGSAVPGAGVDPRIAAGAVFTSFGVPAINDAGDVAFLGRWSAPKTAAAAAQSGTGLFAGDPAALVVKVGDVATGSATFAAFKDPVLNADGAIAFSATLKGAGITSANSTALFTNAFAGGVLTLVAQKGDTSPSTDGATLLSFPSLSLQGAEVLYVAALSGGTPAVTGANNLGAYAARAGATTRVVREGAPFGTTTVRSFRLLGAVAGLARAEPRAPRRECGLPSAAGQWHAGAGR